MKKIVIDKDSKGTIASYWAISLVLAIAAILLIKPLLILIPILVILAVFAFFVFWFHRVPEREIPEGDDSLVTAVADGKIVVVEEAEENTYFHDKRLMISIFMSPLNVHANWFPVDGKVKFVKHFNGNYHKAWLPKASEENEHADIMITTPDGQDILVRQIAGALARRIVTYAKAEEECYIDEHLGFIKLGSRVDVFLPLTARACVTMDQPTTGDQTVIAKLA